VDGYNERLDGLQAALLWVKLAWNAARRGQAERLRDGLPDEWSGPHLGLALHTVGDGCRGVSTSA
jgi:hypothetical protein